jgi:hypothetical protein
MPKPKIKKDDKPKTIPIVKRGAPRLYNHPDILDLHIDDYISKCEEVGKPLTMVGFACFAGMDKDTLTNWMVNKTHDLYRPTKRLKLLCEDSLLNRAITQNNPTGAIFALKCNHNYIEVNKTINEVKAFDPKEQACETVDSLIKKLSNDKPEQDVIDITPDQKKITE